MTRRMGKVIILSCIRYVHMYHGPRGLLTVLLGSVGSFLISDLPPSHVRGLATTSYIPSKERTRASHGENEKIL